MTMGRHWLAAVLIWGAASGGAMAGPVTKPVVAELLEDNAEALLKQFTNPGGDHGQGFVEKAITFSGTSSIKIVPLQRYEPRLPGWKYRIAEHPKSGEFRYLRLAWKADGCAGLMIQFHDEKDWHLRYTAGSNQHGWASKFVADKAPGAWALVTCDLYKDFGDRTLTGMALTVFGGTAGYFDHIYLGRTVDDLDRIDATGLGQGKPVQLAADDLERLWIELAGADAAVVYRSFWTLVAAPKQSVPFLTQKLAGPKVKPDLKQIKHWIAQLDDAKFLVREKASKYLAQHVDLAADLLESELDKSPSPEVFLRVKNLLELRKSDPDGERPEKAVRVLEYAATAEARTGLAALAKEADMARVRKAAAAALKRLAPA